MYIGVYLCYVACIGDAVIVFQAARMEAPHMFNKGEGGVSYDRKTHSIILSNFRVLRLVFTSERWRVYVYRHEERVESNRRTELFSDERDLVSNCSKISLLSGLFR